MKLPYFSIWWFPRLRGRSYCLSIGDCILLRSKVNSFLVPVSKTTENLLSFSQKSGGVKKRQAAPLASISLFCWLWSLEMCDVVQGNFSISLNGVSSLSCPQAKCTTGFVADAMGLLIGAIILINLVTAALVTRRLIRKTAGLAANSPYTLGVAICLESSVLIVAINFSVLVVLFVQPLNFTLYFST